jgi:hypothetical protein|tara:strand:- start:972 stop:1124 length:153 start_codon:yes stop_codon:yes gene_type:complete
MSSNRAETIQELYDEYYHELMQEGNIDPAIAVLEAMRLAQENYDRRVDYV